MEWEHVGISLSLAHQRCASGSLSHRRGPVQVARLGVTSILVHSGMTCQAFQQGLQEHARQENGR